jgi:hypothetical protein
MNLGGGRQPSIRGPYGQTGRSGRADGENRVGSEILECAHYPWLINHSESG